MHPTRRLAPIAAITLCLSAPSGALPRHPSSSPTAPSPTRWPPTRCPSSSSGRQRAARTAWTTQRPYPWTRKVGCGSPTRLGDVLPSSSLTARSWSTGITRDRRRPVQPAALERRRLRGRRLSRTGHSFSMSSTWVTIAFSTSTRTAGSWVCGVVSGTSRVSIATPSASPSTRRAWSTSWTTCVMSWRHTTRRAPSWVRSTQISPAANSANSLALDAKGNVYISACCGAGNQVEVFDATGTPIATMNYAGTGQGQFIDQPLGMAIDGGFAGRCS